jgi:tRNA (cmo5U34)-methyltransferase
VKKVKNHFEEEAKEFDSLILKLIPHYREMIASLVAAIPFNNSKPIKVLDLGCGTGNISKAVKERFPQSRITCIDLAENMIKMAQIKLSRYHDIQYQLGDFGELEFEKGYDVVVSSLALHHLPRDEEKKLIYSRIYDALQNGGVFYQADNVLGPNKYLNDIYLEKWKGFMSKNISKSEIEEKWLPKHYEEDFPAPLMDHLDWLSDIGFKDLDVVWKYSEFAVFGGYK